MAEGEQLAFTYDVLFKPSDIKWASRWDTYLQMTDDQIHWFSIINSLMIVLFLTGARSCVGCMRAERASSRIMFRRDAAHCRREVLRQSRLL